MSSARSKETATLLKQKAEVLTLSSAAEGRSGKDVDKTSKSEVIAHSDNNEDNIEKEKEVGIL